MGLAMGLAVGLALEEPAEAAPEVHVRPGLDARRPRRSVELGLRLRGRTAETRTGAWGGSRGQGRPRAAAAAAAAEFLALDAVLPAKALRLLGDLGVAPPSLPLLLFYHGP